MDDLNQAPEEAEPPSTTHFGGALTDAFAAAPAPAGAMAPATLFPLPAPPPRRVASQRVPHRSLTPPPHRFPISPAVKSFIKRFYPDAKPQEWNDWRWQLRHRIKDLRELSRIIRLSDQEAEAIARHKGSLPVGITPYYAHLISESDPNEPIRRTHVPVPGEYLRTPGEADDPLGEDHDTAVPGLVHRYPDRVLFLTTGFCSTYCRYCTRSRMVGEAGGEYSFSMPQWERALDYLAEHSEVRDVLLSGGDPLTLHDDKLDWLLTRLRAIPHIEFVRLGSKVPVVLPQRITRELVRMLRRHRVWLSLHVTHPSELTIEVSEAFDRLADAGLPLGSQTVLLKGVNDTVETMTRLMHGLLMRRVKPYYLYQCDPITGSAHFRTSVDKGLEIIAGLRGHTSGYAVPTFVIDAPGGGGKIPLLPDSVVGRQGDDLVLRNFEGKLFCYRDPDGEIGRDKPLDPAAGSAAGPIADAAE